LLLTPLADNPYSSREQTDLLNMSLAASRGLILLASSNLFLGELNFLTGAKFLLASTLWEVLDYSDGINR